MKPILYKFSINGRVVHPNYGTDLGIDYEKESSQEFFREKLSGKITLEMDDYDWINAQPFETEFVLLLQESFDLGKSWKDLFTGKFMKTDCKWDDDHKTCEVEVDERDQYNDVIDSLDKEYNIIPLAPETTALTIAKRPLIQVYIPGDSVVSCFLGGTYWEQEVTEEITDTVALRRDYYFELASQLMEIKVTAAGGASMAFNGVYVGKRKEGDVSLGIIYTADLYAQGLSSYIHYERFTDSDGYGNEYSFYTKPGGDMLYYYKEHTLDDITMVKFSMPSSGGPGELVCDVKLYQVWMRYLLDVEEISGKQTYPIPTEDLLDNNSNYKRCIGYDVDLAVISGQYSDDPTEYGRADNGKYFAPPYSITDAKFFPISKSNWTYASIWFAFDDFDWVLEEKGRKEYQLKDAYLLSSVINVLLQQFSDIKHEATPEYSQFLYGDSNPITHQKFTLLITQKTNLLKGEYDQPAQKAETTLGTILNALRDMFRCYWYIEDGKLKIEHIKFFMNGGSYEDAPSIGTDLTQLQNVSNGKKWGYLTSNYEFDKSDMPARYQLSWMDDVTEAFEGSPIEIRSKYVTSDNIEEVSVSSITTDVDYMLLNPSAISEDGFAMFAAVSENGQYKLPFVQRTVNGTDVRMQNGYLSFVTLVPNYYIYDLPAKAVTINGEDMVLSNTSKSRKQKLKFPSVQELDTSKLVKTYIGNGQIEKITLNLSSRMNEVTLVYDTEQ